MFKSAVVVVLVLGFAWIERGNFWRPSAEVEMIEATHAFLRPKLATAEFINPPFKAPLKVTFQPNLEAKITSYNHDNWHDVRSWVDVREVNGEGYRREYACEVQRPSTVRNCQWR